MKNQNIKHYILLCTLFILMNCLAKPKQEYEIKFKNEIHDFGTVVVGVDIEFDYVFTNTGSQPIKIEDVRPSCGCTVAGGWDKEVASGQEGLIPITFKTKGLFGEVTRNIIIRTNIPGQAMLTLTVKGNVVGPVNLEPRSVNLGDVMNSAGLLSGTFIIKNYSEKPLKILEIVPPDNVEIDYDLEILEEGQQFKLDFTLKPPLTGKGEVRKSFTIKTDNKEYPYCYPDFTYFMVPDV